ncbi:SRPBCC family protein [Kribbella sp. NPDC050470]|uniref:SRPBCC family protein n=1 Tax=unclassified Kribbella TaxID=2644121 RepID=UPI0037BD0685
MEQATMVIPATPNRIRAVLLDPRALPLWNEAFLSVDGPAQPAVGQRYALRVRPGLSGRLEYAVIEADRIELRWEVPGFRESGTWTIGESGLVGHDFTQAGPLATLLRTAYRGIAAVRLDRLADRVRQLPQVG